MLPHCADQGLGEAQDELQNGDKKADDERKEAEQETQYRLQIVSMPYMALVYASVV